MTVFLINVALYAAMYASFLAWQEHGIQAAGNGLVFVCWAVSVIKIMPLFLPCPDVPRKNLTPLVAAYIVLWVCLAISFAAVGHYALAGAMVAAELITVAAHFDASGKARGLGRSDLPQPVCLSGFMPVRFAD